MPLEQSTGFPIIIKELIIISLLALNLSIISFQDFFTSFIVILESGLTPTFTSLLYCSLTTLLPGIALVVLLLFICATSFDAVATLILPFLKLSSNLFNLVTSFEVSYSILHILITANSQYNLACLLSLALFSASWSILIHLIISSALKREPCSLIKAIFSSDISSTSSGLLVTLTISKFL